MVFESNGDGKLTASDADFAKFKLLVTNADGTTMVKTLAQLNITGINLTADTTRIELPDGSVITRQTTFKYSSGATGTVANTTLVAEAQGHRVVQTTSTDGNGNTVVVSTGYAADGSVAFAMKSVTSPTGASITNTYDANGDGVTDRIQTITRVTNGNGSKTETEINKAGSDAGTAILMARLRSHCHCKKAGRSSWVLGARDRLSKVRASSQRTFEQARRVASQNKRRLCMNDIGKQRI